MNCTQTESWLDLLLDDALSAEDLRALEMHAQDCETCAEKLRAAKQLKAALSLMTPEIDVPLEGQANWRSAVKAEAGKARRKRFYRYAAGIAAAFAVLAGVALTTLSGPSATTKNEFTATEKSFALEDAAEMADAAPEAEYEAVIEADGFYAAEEAEASGPVEYDAEPAMLAAPMSVPAPMRQVHMTVADIDEACAYIGDLVEEYGGSFDEQRFEENGIGCANLYVSLAESDATDFISASWHYDTSGSDAPVLSFDASADNAVSLQIVLRTE